jgi:hypothetical protein
MRKFITQTITRLFHRGGEPLPQPPAPVVEPTDEPEWHRRIRAIDELVLRHRERVRIERLGPQITTTPEEAANDAR